MAFVANTSKWKLGGAIWIAGMIGVLAVMFIMLPVLISQHPPRSPLRVPVWGACLGGLARRVCAGWCIAGAFRLVWRSVCFESRFARTGLRGFGHGPILGSSTASTALARPPRRVDRGHNSVVFHLAWSDL